MSLLDALTLFVVMLPLAAIPSSSLKLAGTGQRSSVSLVADFLAGLLLTLGDVKAIFFYASLFPALVDMQQVGVRDAVSIAAIMVVTVGGVKLTYANFAARIVDKLSGRVSSDIPRKLGGSLMIGCGSALIVKA